MKQLRAVFFASFFFSVHTALLAYLNSSMLSQYAAPKTIGVLYTAASMLSLVLVLLSARFLGWYGNKKVVYTALSASTILLLGISSTTGVTTLFLFTLYFSLNAVVLYGIDIFIEHYSKEQQTGNIRGTYLTLTNIGWVLAPVISGSVESRFGFAAVYIIAACAVLITLISLYRTQKQFVDKPYKTGHLIEGIKLIAKQKQLRIIVGLNFLLQLFFVFMVIYSPLYLTTVVGFSWKTLGLILSIMLIPFVLIPLPAGRYADSVLGEKEFLIGGFLTAAVAALFFSHVQSSSVVFFAVILFVSRIGASLVETMCESYFFKQVTDSDAGIISVYRNMLPVAYVVGPLLGMIVFTIGSYTLVFAGAAFIMLAGAVLSLTVKDTR